MSNQMAEKAQLYWEGLTALEEARSELVKYLEEIWNQVWERVVPHGVETAGEGENARPTFTRSKEDRAGEWWIYLPALRIKMNIGVRDPRRSEDREVYSISVFCSMNSKRSLERIAPNSLDALSQLASALDVSTNWSRPSELAVQTVRVNPQDATEVVGGIVEAIEKFLTFLERVDTWVRDQEVGKPGVIAKG
jgi:hypothetical protein